MTDTDLDPKYFQALASIYIFWVHQYMGETEQKLFLMLLYFALNTCSKSAEPNFVLWNTTNTLRYILRVVSYYTGEPCNVIRKQSGTWVNFNRDNTVLYYDEGHSGSLVLKPEDSTQVVAETFLLSILTGL